MQNKEPFISTVLVKDRGIFNVVGISFATGRVTVLDNETGRHERIALDQCLQFSLKPVVPLRIEADSDRG